MSLFKKKSKGGGGLLEGLQKKVLAEGEKKQASITALENTGVAPSEMSADEMKAHDKQIAGIPKMQKSIANAEAFVSRLNAPSPMSTLKATIKQKQSATAGTTPPGMGKLISPNLLGSGPSPAGVGNAMMMFRKKSKLF